MIEQGYQHIAFCDEEHCYTTGQRYLGYLQAYQKAGLHSDSKLHLKMGQHTPDQVAEKLLSLKPRPTAVMALSDFHAKLLYEAFQSRGIQIPDDIAITGYDNLDFTSLISPPLTTIEPPSDLIATHAFDLMLRMLNENDFSPVNIVIPVELEVRGSTQKKRGAG